MYGVHNFKHIPTFSGQVIESAYHCEALVRFYQTTRRHIPLRICDLVSQFKSNAYVLDVCMRGMRTVLNHRPSTNEITFKRCIRNFQRDRCIKAMQRPGRAVSGRHQVVVFQSGKLTFQREINGVLLRIILQRQVLNIHPILSDPLYRPYTVCPRNATAVRYIRM